MGATCFALAPGHGVGQVLLGFLDWLLRMDDAGGMLGADFVNNMRLLPLLCSSCESVLLLVVRGDKREVWRSVVAI